MFHLQKMYLCCSRRDLVSKFNSYKNVHQVSFIKFMSLTFLKLKKKPLALLGLGFFFLVTNKKGCLALSSRKALKKSFGCYVKLKNEEALNFIEKFLKLSFKNIMDLEEGFSKKSFSTMGTFGFFIKDIYSFSELGDVLFKFRNLNNLNVVFDFSSKDRLENIELLRSLGFVFSSL